MWCWQFKAGSVRPRETAIVQNIDPGDLIGKRRQQAFHRGGDLIGCAVFFQGNVRGLVGQTLLKRDAGLGRALGSQISLRLSCL